MYKNYYKIKNNCGYEKWEWEAIQADPKKDLFLGTKLIDRALEVTIISEAV